MKDKSPGNDTLQTDRVGELGPAVGQEDRGNTSNLTTQVMRKALAQDLADIELKGATSDQGVVQSVIVSR